MSATAPSLTSPTPSELREDIRQLYLQLTGGDDCFGDHKIEGFNKEYPEVSQQRTFFFLRTFVPYYYKCFLTTFGARVGIPQTVLDPSYVGWCAGDAHCGNFGIGFDGQNNPVFSINDFDDCGKTYLYVELVRFLTSCILNPSADGTDTVDVDAILREYCSGLEATIDPRQPSSSKEEQQWKTGKWNDASVSKKSNPLPPDDPMRPVLQKVLQDNYVGKISKFDVGETSKTTGGSGYLKRYLATFQLEYEETGGGHSKKKKTDMAIEFKQEILPSVMPMWQGDVCPPMQARLPRAIGWEIGSNSPPQPWSMRIPHTEVAYYSFGVNVPTFPSAAYPVVGPPGTEACNYLLRPKLKGLQDAADVFTDRGTMYLREARVLGYLHAHQGDGDTSGLALYASVCETSAAMIFSDVKTMTNLIHECSSVMLQIESESASSEVKAVSSQRVVTSASLSAQKRNTTAHSYSTRSKRSKK